MPDDYVVVRDLVADLFAEALDVAVSDSVRDVVDVVQRLTSSGEPCSVAQVGRVLKVDASTASRRVKTAVAAGYLLNRETKPGRPAQLVVGDPLPNETEVLPPVATLAEVMQRGGHGLSSTATGTTGNPCTDAAIAVHSASPKDTDDETRPDWVSDDDDDDTKLLLNKENTRNLIEGFGTDETDDWVGRTFEAYYDPSVTFGGKRVGGLRVRVIA